VRVTSAYQRVFRELAGKDKYRTFTVAEFYVDRRGVPVSNRVNVVVRVDVDNCLHLEPCLAETLRRYGIESSHYFLTHPSRYYQLWGSGIPRRVHELGHEVGLHSDHYFEQLTRGIEGLAQLREDIRSLAQEVGAPIRGMCFHGHSGMDALGNTNWELTRDVPPADLGLEYHDGKTSCYLAPGAKSWRPACDHQISDFLGFPNSWGWNYVPSLPIKALRRAQRGEIVHLVFHTKNAFRYWEGWTEAFKERRRYKEPLSSFIRKMLLIHLREGGLLPKQLIGKSYALTRKAGRRILKS
jgi:hypothetical protein